MTSKRKSIISALGKNGLSTMDDLGFTTGIVRKSLHDNVKSAVQDGLAERTMDDITNQPAYVLTKKGREWLVKNHNECAGERPQPMVGKNVGSDESAPHVVGSLIAEPPSEVVTVIEPPKPDDAPVEAGSNEGDMPTDKACCNAAAVVAKTAGGMVGERQKRCTEHEKTIAGLQEKLEHAESNLESMYSAARKFCSIASGMLPDGTKYPLNLYECSVVLESYIENLSAELATLKAENTALKTLNEAMPGFGAAYAQNQGQQYAILTALDDIYSTPEEAANHAHEYAVQDDISKVQIIAIRQVGRVEVKAVFVPNQEAA